MSMLKRNLAVSKRKLTFIVYSFFYLFLFYNFLVVSTARYGSIVTATLNLEICVAILVSFFFIRKINDIMFCYIASFLIGIASIFLFILDSLLRLALIFSIAPLFSIGLLIFFNYFQRTTASTERIRVVEVIACTVLPFVFILELLPPDSIVNFYLLILIILLSIGFFLFNFFRTDLVKNKKEEAQHFFEKKTIFLYSVPWILFSIINGTLGKNNSTHFFEQTSTSLYVFLIAFQVIGVNLGAIIAGRISNFFGRRVTLASALTLYGTSSALGALFINPVFLTAMYLVDGMSWGILFVMYIFIVWGDLANNDNGAKIYSLGSLIYFLSIALACITPAAFLSITSSSLLTCLIAFFSVLPIIIVPEIADKDFIERTKFQHHIKNIKKLQN